MVAKSISVPQLNSAITMELPDDDIDVRLLILVTVAIAFSSGLVTMVSISSGPTPSYSEITTAAGNVISGSRSTFTLVKAIIPSKTTSKIKITVVTGRLIEKFERFI